MSQNIDEKKKDLEYKLKEYIAHEYNGLWNTRLEDMFVARDFLRLEKKFIFQVPANQQYIVSEWNTLSSNQFTTSSSSDNLVATNSSTLSAPSSSHPSQKERIVLLLNTIAKLFNYDVEQHLTSSEEMIPLLSTDDFDKSTEPFDFKIFEDYILRFYGDQTKSKVIKLLKLVDQAYIVCLLGHFTETVYYNHQFRFKDVSGSWQVIVKKSEDGFYSVAHKRRERVIKIEKNIHIVNSFYFEWIVEMTLSPAYSTDQLEKIQMDLLAFLPTDNQTDFTSVEQQDKSFIVQHFGKPVLDQVYEYVKQKPMKRRSQKLKEELIAAAKLETSKPKKKSSGGGLFLSGAHKSDADLLD